MFGVGCLVTGLEFLLLHVNRCMVQSTTCMRKRNGRRRQARRHAGTQARNECPGSEQATLRCVTHQVKLPSLALPFLTLSCSPHPRRQLQTRVHPRQVRRRVAPASSAVRQKSNAAGRAPARDVYDWGRCAPQLPHPDGASGSE